MPNMFITNLHYNLGLHFSSQKTVPSEWNVLAADFGSVFTICEEDSTQLLEGFDYPFSLSYFV